MSGETDFLERWTLIDIKHALKNLESRSERILDRMPSKPPLGAQVDAQIADRCVPGIQQDIKMLLLEVRFVKERLDRLTDRPEPESTGCFRFIMIIALAVVLFFSVKINRNVRALADHPSAVEQAQPETPR
jgi:hypothetical protein